MPSAIQNQITQQALALGVPPSIALAVAQQESSFNPNARGAAGEIGLFQLMPATAASLGVDPSDVSQNISGGISFLAQLFQKYGNWPAALSAYNSGSPTRSTGYANSVLAIAGGDPTLTPAASPSDTSGYVDISSPDTPSTLADSLGIDPNLLIAGGVLAALGLLWWVTD
jgi:soluble lytic murein transglycosylase-like protein